MKSTKIVSSKMFLTTLVLLFLGFNSVAQTFPKVAKVDFRYNTAPASKSLYVRTNALSVTCLFPNPLPIVKKATLYAVLNWKGDYDNVPANNTEYTVTLNIQAYTSYTGTTGLLATYTPTLVVNTNTPQSYVAFDFTGLHSTANRFLVTATYTPTGTVNTAIQSVIETDVYYSEEFEYNVSYDGSGPMLIANSVTFNGNEARFLWVDQCTSPAPNHQFQLLRLYNTNSAKTTNEADIDFDLDWTKALTIETGNSLEELTLTLAEGTGYYIWRVRPIGNAYEGGIADDRNWGIWSTAGSYVQGSSYSITNSYSSSTMAGVPYLIYYVPPASEIGRNWIFSRSFIEGDASAGTGGQVNIGESISYANGLQMTQQSQTRIKSAGKIIANEIIYDYSGRPALSTLPSPVGNSTLGYISNYIKNTSSNTYSALDFDTDVNYNNPAAFDSISSVGPGKYYSNLNNLEQEVPSASGFPFSRTLYMRDGTSKPKEQSSPGLFHKLGNTAANKHTTRNYVSSVADIELITVFGDEAPVSTSVKKSITTDANGESIISYISKEGQIIATCLSAPGATNLDALPSVPASPLNIDYYLDNNSSYGINGLIASKSIVLTEPTTIYLSYTLTPNVYSDNCIPFCATCDYKITIKVINDDDPAAAPLYTFTKDVNPTSGTTSCTGSPVTDLVTPVSVPLSAGSFTIQRTIESNQINPSLTPPTTSPLATLPSTPYIDQYLISIENTIRNNFSTGTATIVDDLGAPIVGAPSVNMATLMTYFDLPYGTQPDMTALFTLLGVTTQDHVNLKVGCDIVKLPISFCPSTACPPGNNFEQYLIDWCAAKGLTYSVVAAKIIPSYATGEFNTVIANMIDPTCGNYDCQALFACWKTVIGTYESLEGMAGTSLAASSGGFTMPSGTYTPDYLDMFLDCAGYKIIGINTSVGALGCSNPGYKFHPYAYINYTAGNRCLSCEQMFYAIINGNLATYPYTASQANFITYFNTFTAVPYSVVVTNSTGTVTVYPKDIFMDCIKNCNTTGTVPSTSTFETSTENTCKATCEERYGEFVNLITQEYNRAGKYIEGDLYTLVFDATLNYYVFSPTAYDYTTGPYVTFETVYCEAQQLVEACKSYCVLTVTTSAGQTVVGTPTEHQNMATAMYGAYDVSLPDGSGNCLSGYTATSTSNLPAANFMQYVVNVLNLKLAQLQATAPIDGFYWNYRSFLENDVNSYFVASGACSATNKFVFIHPNIPSYFEFETGSPYNLVYYFNKTSPTLAGGSSTKALYSVGLITPASPFNSPGFNYISAPTKTGAQALLDQLVDGKLGYYMPSGFSAVATSALTTSALDMTSVYNAGTITGATSLYNYILTTSSEHGYYKYVLCTAIGSGNANVSCGKICYKITPPTVVTTSSPVFLAEGNTYLAITCEQESVSEMMNSFYSQLSTIIDNERAKIKTLYHQKCINELVDQVKISYGIKYHHYTLYYYDRAGNLVKTVPPRGVVLGTTTRSTHPAHTMVSEYAFTSLGQLNRQKTPDGGESFFWCDNKGRLRFSQNAKQLANSKMSYTKYDELGRVFEAGEMPQSVAPATDANTANYPTTGMADITVTVYTVPASGVMYFGGKSQRYLQNRVSYSYTDRDGSASTLLDRVSTYYSYDPHGNVEWLIQDIPDLGRNYIAYEYDLISGIILKVKYNEKFPDKFFHKYTYDINKRIKTLETSKDEVYWEKEADYSYYLHGPLKRAEIGQDKIQGLDYVYTIQGWLKGMNHVESAYDMGLDGNETGNSYFPKDVYSFGLGYFKGDFLSKSSRYNSTTSNPYNLAAVSGRDLYNGNISTWTSKFDIDAINVLNPALSFQYKDKVTGRAFKYDELNRIKEAQYLTLNPTWANTNDYFENFTYDANGNIQTLTRKGYGITAAEQKMDIMTYNYYSPTTNNKLQNVIDTDDNSVPARYQDIKTQTAFPTNYTYDAIGNLIADGQEGITSIQWNVYGKITKIIKLVAGVNQTIEFLYDASGKRVAKKVYDQTATNYEISAVTTYYVFDASGNTMAIYGRTNSNAGPFPNYMANFDLKEQPIYGSDRIGERSLSGVILRQVPFAYPATPVPQNLPTVVHVSGWPNMILPLSNSAATQLYFKKLNTNSATNVAADLGANELTISAGSGTVAHGRNQAVLMDEFGNVILTAYAYTRTVAPLTYSRIYSYSKTLIINSDLINSNPACQSVFVKRPGSSGEYYYITIGNDNRPYYHIIDLTSDYVTSYDNLIDNSATYGQSMAVIEDRVGQGTSTLFLKSYSGGTTTIKEFSITANGIVPTTVTPVTFTSAATTGNEGEIVISSDGLKMGVANTVGTTGELRVYSIGADHQTLASLGKLTMAATTTARYVEFTGTDARIYFTQRTGTTANAVYRVQTSLFASSSTSLTMTSATLLVSTTTSTIGAIRKGSNSNIYYTTNTTAVPNTLNIHMITAVDGTPVVGAANAIATVVTNGSLPVQPHVIDYQLPTTIAPVLARNYKQKVYEIKDHLGNVHSTLYDYKIAVADANIKWDKRFDNNTTEGFAVLTGSPGGTVVDNVNNQLRIFGTVGSTANVVLNTTTLPSTVGNRYVLSFDYVASTASSGSYTISTTGSTLSTTGFLNTSGRYTIPFVLPTGTTGTSISFRCEDAAANKTFYIDNALIKSTASTLIDGIVTLDQTGVVPTDWIGTNGTVGLTTGVVTFSNASSVTTASVNKDLVFIPGLVYKASFTLNAVGVGTGTPKITMGYLDNDNVPIDYKTFIRSTTGSATYDFYFIPKTALGILSFNYDNGTAQPFNFTVTNLVVTQYENQSKSLYVSSIVNLQDYYSFGMLMPGRGYVGNNYRYGFNGKENDNEVKGAGTQYDYGFRIYDPRLGRFLSVDPLTREYPWYTPYQFAGNSPILNIDLDGLEDCDYKLFLQGLINGQALISNLPFPEMEVVDGRAGGKWRISPDNEYWRKYGNGSAYKMKDGKSPSKALMYYIQNQGGMDVDCAQFVQLEILYAMCKSMGNKEFDKYIRSENDGNFLINQFRSTGINTLDLFVRNSDGLLVSDNNKTGKKTTISDDNKFYNELPIGSRLYIQSSGYELGVYNGENIIKVGDDKYNAQGIGQSVSLSYILEELPKHQKAIDGQTQKTEVKEVTTYKINLTNKTE